ncbi:MAG: Holliday junction resolvase RuvX [Hydrogenoanaerobacterium sp.]
MKIMAVDFGDSRTGLAVCDKTEFLASPIGVIQEKDFDTCVQKVSFAIQEYDVGEVVIGHPKNMNGTIGERAQKCELFAQKLGELTTVPIKLWDERSTTVSAIGYLNETNTRGKKRKAVIDAVAATIILESYMAYRKNQKEEKQ